jgi:hypothetical protein
MVHKLSALIVFVLIFSAVPAVAKSSEKEKAAAVSAEGWLQMVDSEKYAESWKEALNSLRMH